MPHKTELDAIILRAIPFHPTCAIEEAYNKTRREWLKKEFTAYISEELSDQFNARALNDQISTGVPATTI